MTARQLENITRWLKKAVPSVRYGAVKIEISRHDNYTRLIEKSITVKEKPLKEWPESESAHE